MSNQENLVSCLDAIRSIPQTEVSEPSIPIDVFVQEAEDLYHWASDDKTQLQAAGLTAVQLDELPVRAGACREAQSLWMKESRSQDNWNAQSPAAYELRDELLHTFRFAFRKDDGLLSRVDEIAAGTGHEDMVQDLNDLSVLGKKNTAALSAINFDLTKLDTAATLSDQMAEMLAATNGVKTGGSDVKYLRDQAYTYLKQLVDEVRATGKFVFWRNERRLKGYSSAFWRKKNSRKETEATEVETTAE